MRPLRGRGDHHVEARQIAPPSTTCVRSPGRPAPCRTGRCRCCAAGRPAGRGPSRRAVRPGRRPGRWSARPPSTGAPPRPVRGRRAPRAWTCPRPAASPRRRRGAAPCSVSREDRVGGLGRGRARIEGGHRKSSGVSGSGCSAPLARRPAVGPGGVLRVGQLGPPRCSCSNSVQQIRSPLSGTEPGRRVLAAPHLVQAAAATRRAVLGSYATNSGLLRLAVQGAVHLRPLARGAGRSSRADGDQRARARALGLSPYAMTTSVTSPANASPASRRPAITSGSSSASLRLQLGLRALARRRACWRRSPRRRGAAAAARPRHPVAVAGERPAVARPARRRRARPRAAPAAGPGRATPPSQVGRMSCSASSSRISRSAAVSWPSRSSACGPSSAAASAWRARS